MNDAPTLETALARARIIARLPKWRGDDPLALESDALLFAWQEFERGLWREARHPHQFLALCTERRVYDQWRIRRGLVHRRRWLPRFSSAALEGRAVPADRRRLDDADEAAWLRRQTPDGRRDWRERLVVVLYYLEEWTVPAIAGLLGLRKDKTVYHILERWRKRTRKALEVKRAPVRS